MIPCVKELFIIPLKIGHSFHHIEVNLINFAQICSKYLKIEICGKFT